MSRILKFRVWDKIKTEMLYDALVQVAVESSLLSDEQNVVRAFPFEGIESGEFLYGPALESVEVMLYTGLRDRHGKEIYEGDIYATWYSRDMSGRDIVRVLEIVTFDADHEESGFEILFSHNAEVIGNVFETPELIQQLKTQSI